MKENLEKIKKWYAALDQRERRAVNIGGTALALAIFYFGIWSPFLSRVEAMRKRISSDQKTLVFMQQADNKLKQLAGSSSTETTSITTPVAMLAYLQDAIAKAGLKDALKDMKQAANDSIQLSFKNVSFDNLVKMLMNVMKSSHVNVTQFTAVAEKTPGMVNAEVMLQLSAK